MSGGIPAHLTFPLAFLYAMCMPLGSTRSPAADGDDRPPPPLPPCQAALEVSPAEAIAVNSRLAIRHEGEGTVYYHYLLPLHCHQRDDCRTRNRIVSQLVCLGAATVAELAAALDLSERTIHRAVKARQRAGEAAFDGERARRGPTALTDPAQLQQAADLLASGLSLRQVAAALGVSHGTVHRYRKEGLLPPPGAVPSMSSAAWPPASVAAAPKRFADCLGSLRGYYSSASVLLLLAFMLLARVPNPERLRYQAPGEWGRLLGLDRCPAPDVLRRKIAALADPPETVRTWLLALASHWCSADLQVRAALFFDGHVKVYTGQHNLARHFVSRQRLNLPAAAGFWANVPGGAPLLALPQEVDPGLRRALWDDLLPQLEQLGLLPPPAADPAQEPLLTLVFDREGWSPEMFLALRARGVACATWIKGEQAGRWPEAEFSPTDIPLRTPLGVETGRGQLAERPLDLLDGDLPAREIRFWIDERGRPSGRGGQPRKARRLAGRPSAGRRQPAILTTHPSLPAAEVAGLLRSRWAQENAFKTLRQEFGLDSLPQHAVQEVEPATLVVNPAMHVIEKALKKNRRQAGKLRREQAQLRGRRRDRDGRGSHRGLGTGARLDPLACPGRRTGGRAAPADAARAAAQLLGRPAHARLPCRDAARRDGGPAVGQARRRAQLRQGAVPMRRQLAAARGGRHPARATAAPLATQAQDEAAAALCAQLNACRAVYLGTNLRLEYQIMSASPPAAQ